MDGSKSCFKDYSHQSRRTRADEVILIISSQFEHNFANFFVKLSSFKKLCSKIIYSDDIVIIIPFSNIY